MTGPATSPGCVSILLQSLPICSWDKKKKLSAYVLEIKSNIKFPERVKEKLYIFKKKLETIEKKVFTFLILSVNGVHLCVPCD